MGKLTLNPNPNPYLNLVVPPVQKAIPVYKLNSSLQICSSFSGYNTTIELAAQHICKRCKCAEAYTAWIRVRVRMRARARV